MKRTILITGGNSGLGKALATQLAEQGHTVLTASRSDETYALDLTDNAKIIAVCQKIVADHPELNTLILNAGVIDAHPIAGANPEMIDKLYAVNTTSLHKMLAQLMPIIEKNCGDVVIISSTSGLNPYPNETVYGATKSAASALARNAQGEYKNKDVRIMCVQPGGMRTELFEHGNLDIDTSEMMPPEHVARGIVSLLDLPRTVEVSSVTFNRKKDACRKFDQ